MREVTLTWIKTDDTASAGNKEVMFTSAEFDKYSDLCILSQVKRVCKLKKRFGRRINKAEFVAQRTRGTHTAVVKQLDLKFGFVQAHEL